MHKDHLLTIIKTLSPQNKKYLSLYIKRNCKKSLPNYIQLYQLYAKLIDKCDNEEEIKLALQKQLKRKPKLSKHIAKYRNLLKERLFSILLTCEKEEDAEQQIEYSIQVIKMLIKRKLFEVARQKIDLIKEQAKLFNLHSKIIDLIKLELELINLCSYKNDINRQTKLIKNLECHMRFYAKELQFEGFLHRLSLVAEKDSMNLTISNKKNVKIAYYQYKIDKFDIKAHIRLGNIRLVCLYYRIQNLYFRLMGEPKKSFKFSKSLILFFETDIQLKNRFQTLYLKSICSHTKACRVNGCFSAIEQNLLKVYQIYESNKNYTALEVTCDIGVLYFLNQKKYKKAIEFADLMEQEWKTIQSNSSDGKQLWYCHSNLLLFWVIGNRHKFEYWLNNGLDIPRSNKSRTIYFSIRMLSLLFDLDNKELYTFNEKLKALQKTLQNNQNLNEFEKIVLHHFRIFYNIEFGSKYVNHHQKEKELLKKQTFQSLKDKLKNLKFKMAPINYEEILIWCESNLQNKTIKEVFEAKY